VDYQVFDRLGGVHICNFELARRANSAAGHDPQTRQIAAAFAPHLMGGPRLVGNFGAANVGAGLAEAVAGTREAGLRGTKLAAIHGDNVLDVLLTHNVEVPELECRARDLGSSLLTAHAYIGADTIVTALDAGASVVLGGRICDASLAVGPLWHELDWSDCDWNSLALGTLVGHLLTGGAGLVGGGFADPPYRTVPGLDDLGFPMITVEGESFIISKLESAGGMVTPEVVKCRIGYEVHDPSAYLTPDVTADFSLAEVEQIGPDEVRVSGIRGTAPPESLW